MIRQYDLVEAVRVYNQNTDESLLNKAYVFAMRAHGDQKRASGDPYFSHPIEVALILTVLRPDDACLAAALLHDVLEDTDVTREDLCVHFGEDVAAMVDGVTKLTRLEGKITAESERQAENFRKLLLAGADDIRVLLIKLADRLHNMRTLHHFSKPEKRRRIARETLDLYAPLASRLGLVIIAEELEELSFAQTHPELREKIVNNIEKLRENISHLTEQVKQNVENSLKARGIFFELSWRIKTPYSVFRKMQQKNINFEAMTDIIGFRIITEDSETCYRILGILHSIYSCVPGRFKDYISVPKRNGYRSIHTCVMCSGHRLEIQIRTREMHHAAEHGAAAHRRYKDNGDDPARYTWIREILEEASSGNAVDLLEHVKLEIFPDQVFCFTPNGQLIRLPRGASALDFAYAVHTELGDSCVGAHINGVRVPLRTPVQNGDTVTIINDIMQRPSASWEGLVITGRAKAAIRRFLARRNKEQYVLLGRSIIEKSLRAMRLPTDAGVIRSLSLRAGYKSAEEACLAVGRGQISPDFITETGLPNENVAQEIFNNILHLRRCERCRPLPGDDAVLVYKPFPMLHLSSCLDGEGGVPAEVPVTDSQSSIILRTEIINKPGALGAVAATIGTKEGNIIDCRVITQDSDFQIFRIEVQCRDAERARIMVQELYEMQEVGKCEREIGKEIYIQEADLIRNGEGI